MWRLEVIECLPQLLSTNFVFFLKDFMCMGVLSTCMCIMYMPSASRGQKKALNSLELELQMAVCVLEINLSSQEKQPVHLTAELSPVSGVPPPPFKGLI